MKQLHETWLETRCGSIRDLLVASLAVILLGIPLVTLGEEQAVISMKDATTAISSEVPVFPPSSDCTSSSPCRHVMGEVMRIEESYWIKQPNGNKLHLKATKDSQLETLPRLGDKIIAQVTSTGEVQALKTMEEFPESTTLELPSTSLSDLR